MISHIADQFSVRVAASWSRLNDAALNITDIHKYVKRRPTPYVSWPLMPVLAADSVSADKAKCVVRRTYNNLGDRCFIAAGPRLWNRLPLRLRLCDSLGQFKWLLKTFLLGS